MHFTIFDLWESIYKGKVDKGVHEWQMRINKIGPNTGIEIGIGSIGAKTISYTYCLDGKKYAVKC